jgi:hypothetical protein
MCYILLMKFIFISWNVAGLPHLFNFSGTPTNKANRIYEKLKPYLDLEAVVVIHLQEMFDKKLIANFIECVRDDKYYYVYNPKRNKRFFGINSGMITVSNKKIDDHVFYKYKNSHGEDSFSNKGILASKIKNMWFINTHMQNQNVMIGMYNYAILAHKKQILEFGSFCRPLHSSKCFVSGDFNTSLHDFSRTVKFKEGYESKEPTINNTTPDFFFTNFTPSKIQKIEAIDYPELSDHKMIVMYGIT